MKILTSIHDLKNKTKQQQKPLSNIRIEGKFLNIAKVELRIIKSCVPSTFHFSIALEI